MYVLATAILYIDESGGSGRRTDMMYAFLADLLVAVHLGFIAFVIGGQLVILIGASRRWQWIRNRWFRIGHLLAIVFVALEAVGGMICPLTEWEYLLRSEAGQIVEEDISFVGRFVRELLFYELPTWVFTMAYVSFALVVVVTMVFVPPQWKRPRQPRINAHATR